MPGLYSALQAGVRRRVGNWAEVPEIRPVGSVPRELVEQVAGFDAGEPVVSTAWNVIRPMARAAGVEVERRPYRVHPDDRIEPL